jgi:hypothetical protein
MRLEGLGKLKNANTSSGIESATFRLVTWCLNQLHCRVTQIKPFTSRKNLILMIQIDITENTYIIKIPISIWIDFYRYTYHNTRRISLSFNDLLFIAQVVRQQ